MTPLSVSLGVLTHPLTLCSIVVLLVNDHLLKALVPSVLTGKLSDFAGLFFFPLLLAAGLSQLFDRFHLSARLCGALACLATLVSFTLLKATEWGNALGTSAASRLLGQPVGIALDPSDLVAVPVLWFSWWLWARLERNPAPPRRRRSEVAAALVFLLGAGATVATSPPTVVRVVRLEVAEGVLYAGTTSSRYWPSDTVDHGALRSADGGMTWTRVAAGDVPPDVARQLAEPAQLPATVCDPSQPTICHRVDAQERVEVSKDGGRSWQTAWSLPLGRREYMRRVSWGLDLGPYDIVGLDWQGERILVVASGSEGVLVGRPDGAWERRSVDKYRKPTPYEAGDLGVLYLMFPTPVLFGETLLWILAGVVSWGVLSGLGWQALVAAAKPGFGLGKALWWIGRPLVLAGGTVGGSFLAETSLAVWLVLGGFAVLILAPLVTWIQVVRWTDRPDRAWKVARVSALAATGVWLLPMVAFALWGSGRIPLYEVAAVLAVLFAVLAVSWGVRGVLRAGRARG